MSRKSGVLRILFLAAIASAFALDQRSSTRRIAVAPSMDVPDYVFAPMGFMLRPDSPCIGAGTPVSGVTTDFFGLPVDPVHPSIGAVEYHEATPDYIALVRKILVERWKPTPGGAAEIEDLFFKVYGYRR